MKSALRDLPPVRPRKCALLQKSVNKLLLQQQLRVEDTRTNGGMNSIFSRAWECFSRDISRPLLNLTGEKPTVSS